MRITTWAEYGLIVTIHLARRADEGAIPARTIAQVEHLPADYVEQILLKLRRAGVVSSVRGAKGGYSLSGPPEDTTIRDVIQAAEDHTFEVNCDVRRVNPERCGPGGDCTLRPVWRALQVRVDDFLESISLADLMGDEASVERAVLFASSDA